MALAGFYRLIVDVAEYIWDKANPWDGDDDDDDDDDGPDALKPDPYQGRMLGW